MAGQGGEGCAFAGAGDAFAGFRNEQRAMAGALDQSPGGVEKLIRHPLQRYAPVRAAVDIDEYLLPLTHGEQLAPGQLEAPAAGVCQLIQTA